MLTTRWEPLAELNRLRNEVERVFGRYGVGQPRRFSNSSFPPLNLWEDDHDVFVEAELPGLNLSALEILVTGGNQLSIKGERTPPVQDGGTWHRQERGFGKFSRMLELPVQVDSDKVTAEFKHGVLMITLPKSPELKARKIEVKAG